MTLITLFVINGFILFCFAVTFVVINPVSIINYRSVFVLPTKDLSKLVHYSLKPTRHLNKLILSLQKTETETINLNMNLLITCCMSW